MAAVAAVTFCGKLAAPSSFVCEGATTQTSARHTHSDAVSVPGKRFFYTGGPRTIGRGHNFRRYGRWRVNILWRVMNLPKVQLAIGSWRE